MSLSQYLDSFTNPKEVTTVKLKVLMALLEDV